MPLVTSKTKKAHDEKHMAKQAGKKGNDFPSYKKGDVIVSHASNAHVKVHSIDEKNKGYLGHYHDIEKGETLKQDADPYIAVPHGAEHSHLHESREQKLIEKLGKKQAMQLLDWERTEQQGGNTPGM